MPFKLSALVALVLALSACAGMTTQTTTLKVIDNTPESPSGLWTMEYTAECDFRAPQLLDVTFDDAMAMSFGNYTLNQSDNGRYSASVTATTWLESCQRDVVFIYEYDLVRDDANTYRGTESVTEVGVGTETCSVVLRYADGSVLEVNRDRS